MIPRATYRLQFHAEFNFADARRTVPYLRDLGISHVYASPLAEARSGSTHGYDVTDPTRISEMLGGEVGLRELTAELRTHGMGLILDIVPNHMAASPENAWWADMLKHGQDSRYADFFDVDWSKHEGRILLPVLGSTLDGALDAGDIALAERDGEPVLMLYGEQAYPLAPGSADAGDLQATIEAQHYRLAWWRLGHDELNWRRFFSISDLAGLRIERDEVFYAVHELPLRLYRERLIDGLRIDHVDGLADPATYLRRLRDRLDAIDAERDDGPAWLVVEKILGPGESLPAEWPVDGTTGYEFMDQVNLVLTSGAGEEDLAQFWTELSGRPVAFEEEERRARRQLLHWQFTGQFQACVDALVQLAELSPETALHSRAAWARAAEAVLLLFPVYRTYGTGEDAPAADTEVRETVASRLPETCAPGETELGLTILAWLGGEGPNAESAGEFVQRFQQLSAPIAAKAVEDTAFYRHGKWLARNDVGFDAERFSASADEFHAWQAVRAAQWPHSMLTTATHDHKRGEDVRARLCAISEEPAEWIARSRALLAAMPGAGQIDPGDLYMLLQVVVGAWPDEEAELGDYSARLQEYALKALREGKLRSSWTAPDEDYEQAASAALEGLLLSAEAAPLRQEITAFLNRLAPQERVKSLAQTFLRNTCPGIPDLYQGAELADRSLVDPDNRRPVDYELRSRMLGERASEKQALIRDLLHLRAKYPECFTGGYEPVSLEGAASENLIAFIRGSGSRRLLMLTAIRTPPAGEPPRFDRPHTDSWRSITFPAFGNSLADIASGRGSLVGEALPCAVWLL